MRGILTLMILLFIFSCKSRRDKPSSEFLWLRDSVSKNLAGKLKLNGVYNNESLMQNSLKLMDERRQMTELDTNLRKFENLYCSNPVTFYANGIVAITDGNFLDSLTMYNIYKFHSGKSIDEFIRNKGFYEIKNDTIKAIVYCKYNRNNASLYEYKLTYYKGVINKDNTITDWKIVPPYPQINTEFNKGILENRKEAKVLRFIYAPCKTLIDSTQSWVYKIGRK